MTEEELKKIPFRCITTAAWEHEHTMTYISADGRLGFCDHTPIRKNGDFGRTYRHWRIDNNVYKTKAKFLEALADFPFAESKGLYDTTPKKEYFNVDEWKDAPTADVVNLQNND